MKGKNLDRVGIVKTILMILVILGHAMAFWSGDWFTANPIIPSQGLKIMYTWFNSFHIYGFTLVSGYIFADKIRGEGYSSYKLFLQNKAKRLLIPYVFVAVIWVIPVSILTMKIGVKDIIWKYVLATNPSQLWFLWMLFGVFAIVWPLRDAMSKNLMTGWTVSLVIYAVGVVGNNLLPNVFCIWTACQFVPFFFIGVRIREKEEQGISLLTEKIPVVAWILVDIVLLIAFLSVIKVGGVLGSILSIGIGFVFHFVGAIMAWRVLQWLGSIVNWRENKVFNVFAYYSMPMYLGHSPV